MCWLERNVCATGTSPVFVLFFVVAPLRRFAGPVLYCAILSCRVQKFGVGHFMTACKWSRHRTAKISPIPWFLADDFGATAMLIVRHHRSAASSALPYPIGPPPYEALRDVLVWAIWGSSFTASGSRCCGKEAALSNNYGPVLWRRKLLLWEHTVGIVKDTAEIHKPFWKL
jgi:hypothetical protein